MKTSNKSSSVNRRLALVIIISVPLILSFVAHIWNPVGYPIIHTDEGHYMGRALNFMKGGGVQELDYRYDHPYFGTIFLGSILKLIGYPDSFIPFNPTIKSIEMLYSVPRVLMGLLAVVNTFLVFKIAEIRFNRTVALIASVLFAILPYSFMTRIILIDNIQLPFLLSSILFACYIKIVDNKKKVPLLVLISGIMMGLSIFTKIPAFAFIPLLIYLIYSNANRNLMYLIIWFVPVIMISSIWPFHAISIGEFNKWYSGILYQVDRSDKPFLNQLIFLFQYDPIFTILGFAGLGIAFIKKDLFILLWTIPFMVLLFAINYVSSFHTIPIFPALCVSSALLIYELPKLVIVKRLNEEQNIANLITILIIVPIFILLLVTTSYKVTLSLNGTILKTEEIVTSILKDRYSSDSEQNQSVSVIANPRDLWVPKYVFKMYRNNYQSYYAEAALEMVQNKSSDYFLVVDNNYRNFMNQDNNRGEFLKILYDNSTFVTRIKYGKIVPAISDEEKSTEIRTSWISSFPN